MWVFTKHGFFSVVCAREGRGEHGQPVDRQRMMVRARLRVHLEGLKERFGRLLDDCPIQESPDTDYAYRIFVEKPVWVQVFASLAEEIDYDNFKSEVARNQSQVGATYEQSLHEVWEVMHGLQR